MVVLTELKRARATVIEMLRDRRYTVSGVKKFKNDNELLSDYTMNNGEMTVVHDLTGEKLSVLFYYQSDNSKIGVDTVKKIIKKIETIEDTNNIILVVSEKLTPQSEKLLMQLGLGMEIFEFANLQYNIMRHCLQPRFRILSDKEKGTLIKKFKKKIPFIKKNDKVCQYYNAKPGDIFEIIRKDNSLYYRLVVV